MRLPHFRLTQTQEKQDAEGFVMHLYPEILDECKGVFGTLVLAKQVRSEGPDSWSVELYNRSDISEWVIEHDSEESARRDFEWRKRDLTESK